MKNAPLVARDNEKSPQMNIFPLPLTAFERYMICDERPEYPMAFVIQLELAGKANRSCMEKAFTLALKRHPLLTARVNRKRGKWYWDHASETPPKVVWSEAATDSILPEVGELDLQRGVTLQCRIIGLEESTKVGLLFHHAVCDGIGALRFVGDFLALYGQQTAAPGEEPRLLPLKSENLMYRGVFDVQLPAPVSRWQAITALVRESWKVLSRRPLPLCAEKRLRRDPGVSPIARATNTLSSDVFQRLCTAASDRGVTVNDLMLRDLFLTIRRWNESQGHAPSKHWIRVNMPTSMRSKRDARMPAANVLGYALVTRREDQCGDSEELLSTLAAETTAIRQWSLGGLFIEGLRLIDRVPGGLYLATRAFSCFTTMVLSNVGDPTRRFRARFPKVGNELQVGNLVLKTIIGDPPVRPGTRAAMLVATYGARPTIALRWDPQWLSREDGERFLSLYGEQLERSAAD